MSISINGFNENILTFKAANDFTTLWVPVKMSNNHTVDACSEGDSFCGMSINIRNGFVSTQVSGAVTIGYTGDAPSVGYNMLAANGNKGVLVAVSGGREHLVTDVDTTKSVVTFLL